MSWVGTWSTDNNSPWYFLQTGLPSDNISSYTKIHATLSSFSDNVDHVWLRVKCKKKSDTAQEIYADKKLVVGENDVNLVTLATDNDDADFTKVVDITIWGAREPLTGKTIDGDHPASVIITNVYMFSPTMTITTASGFGEEITDLSYLTNGGNFVIAKADGSSFQAYIAGEAGASAKKLSEYSDNLYYILTLEALPALDVNNDGTNDEATYYRIAIKNESGAAKPDNWWGANYISAIDGFNAIWSSWCDADHTPQYGRDKDFFGAWTFSSYEEGKGFKIYNPAKGMYMTVNGRDAAETYLKLYKGLTISSKTVMDVEKFDNAADDDIFAFSKATGYNTETGEMTNPTWTFETPVDISNWDYLMITTVNNPTSTGGAVTITDDNGVSVGGESYSGSSAGTGGNMWLDQWNNQNAIRISIDYLRINKGMDITKIKSLSISGTTKIANVYLTDYNNTKISGGYKDGDVKREYTATGKWGTICLGYKASYAGCEVYSIVGKSENSITLEKVTGLLEAGKPYFYKSADENGKDNAGAVRNVNFFRADLEAYDAASAGSNNGLVGTFNGITGLTPGDNIYILSSNMLYNVDAGSTGTKAVNVGANKAYVDLSQITSTSTARSINLMFNEPTGINAVSAEGFTGNGEFYNLQGQRVGAPRKGLYILNGKKVIMK